VAVLFSRWAPSERGIQRSERYFPRTGPTPENSAPSLNSIPTGGDETPLEKWDTLRDKLHLSMTSPRNVPAGSALSPSLSQEPRKEPTHRRGASKTYRSDAAETVTGLHLNTNAYHNSGTTVKRKKQFRAMSLLTSTASDFDLISDWLFYWQTLKFDSNYRNSENWDGTPLVPPWLLSFVLSVCIIGTFAWLLLVTDGQIIMPFLRPFNVERISTGRMLLFCVFVEDLPQVFLTFIVEDGYLEQNYMSTFAVCNLLTSIYDIFIKIAEAYDERYDIVETGAWCKESFSGHKACISSVVALHQRKAFPDKYSAPASSENIRFLTGSWDRTVRLWDTSSSLTGKWKKCIKKFKGHKGPVTSIDVLGHNEGYANLHREQYDTNQSEEDYNLFFVSGSNDGTCKLWHLGSGECLRTYEHELSAVSSKERCVTSVACLDPGAGTMFVAGYRDHTARLWDTWTGQCLCVYRGHDRWVTSVCNTGGGSYFLSASADSTIRLWDTDSATTKRITRSPLGSVKIHETKSFSAHTGLVEWDCVESGTIVDRLKEEKVCKRTFTGHAGTVFSIAIVDIGATFVSGSADKTARLWSIYSGACFRIFVGHGSWVSTVCCLDNQTILTGSHDRTAKVWEMNTGGCLRTYSGHKEPINAVASCNNQKGSFLTGSYDKTAKLWAITSVEFPPSTMDHLMDASGMPHMNLMV
jgi:WD40 repeat protein